MINQTQKTLISIIIPVYNGSKYLKQAVDSALAQTYQNIEVLVINDGSKDNNRTHKVCLSYGNRIRYFKKENGGVATALNLGIQKMKGEYFSWLSHDDVFYLEKIEEQVSFAIKNNTEIIYSLFTFIDKDTQILKKQTRRVINHYLKFIKYHDDMKFALLSVYPINGCTTLIHKSVFKKVGFFDVTLRHTQDYDYWLRCAENKINFMFLQKTVLYSRLHENQGSVTEEAFWECNDLYYNYLKEDLKRNIFTAKQCHFLMKKTTYPLIAFLIIQYCKNFNYFHRVFYRIFLILKLTFYSPLMTRFYHPLMKRFYEFIFKLLRLN